MLVLFVVGFFLGVDWVVGLDWVVLFVLWYVVWVLVEVDDGIWDEFIVMGVGVLDVVVVCVVVVVF